MNPLVSTDWLAATLSDPDLRIVDATLVAAETGRDARAEFAAGHLPGAVFLDLASLRDTASPLPNTRPDPASLAARLAAIGVGAGERVVLYDDSPWHSAARAWWLLDAVGVKAAILDGGIATWRAEGRPLEVGEPNAEPIDSRPLRESADRWTSFAEMRAVQRDGDRPIVDARSASRFSGEEADPHPGTAAGHMPGSVNLPYGRLFDPDGRWKQGEALTQAFAAIGIDPYRPFVATCGSGITAAVLAFGARLLGTTAMIYDGSWAEWGADAETPKSTGPA